MERESYYVEGGMNGEGSTRALLPRRRCSLHMIGNLYSLMRYAAAFGAEDGKHEMRLFD